MSITERDFQYECQQAFKLFNCSYHKIPDAPPVFAKPCPKCNYKIKPIYRFTPPKPYDAYVIYQGVHFSLEYKIHKATTAFPFNKLEKHQEIGLLKDQEEGARSFLLINIRTPGKGGGMLPYIKPTNRLVILNIVDFLGLKRKYSSPKISRKSVPVNDLVQSGILIPRINFKAVKGLYWSFEDWMKSEIEKIEVF